MKINLLRPCVLGVTLCLGTSMLVPVAHAKPKVTTTRLEIWPGQRALVVLPLTVSPTFLSTADDASTTPPPADAVPAPGTTGGSALATALVPLLSPQLSEALKATGKFSVIRPYKFDPLIRRAVAESAGGQGLDEAAANNFIEAPSLANASTVLPLLRLDQTGMVAQINIQSLRVGGTSAAPTVQMTVRGDLYEATSPTPFRTITVTSQPFGGATPEERLRAAAGQAFADIATAFVEPPAEFDLPVPTGAAAGMMTGTTPGGTVAPPTQPPATGMGMGTGTNPTTPMPMTPVAPQTPNGVVGAPIAPQLPGSTPPLGINVPDQD